MNNLAFNVSPRLVIIIELIICFCLIVTNILLEYLKIQGLVTSNFRIISLNEEQNLPTFFSVMNLLFVCILLLGISFSLKGKRYFKHWVGLSMIFFYLSLDEFVGIHERVGLRISNLIGSDIGGYLWVVPFSILLIIFAIIYLPFLLSLPVKYRNLFFLSGFIYVMGGLGLEIWGAKLHFAESAYYSVEFILEESMEMLGVILFVYSLLLYRKNVFGNLHLHICFDCNMKVEENIEV